MDATQGASKGAGSPPPDSTIGSGSPATKADFDRLEAQLKNKPSAWGVFGIMVAAIAVPFAILVAWFPREVDDLRSAVTDASENAAAAAETSTAVSNRIDALAVSIARSTAASGQEALMALGRLLPSSTFMELQQSGRLASFRYSDFQGVHWVFVEQADFNLIDPDNQQAVVQSFERYDVRYFFDEQ